MRVKSFSVILAFVLMILAITFFVLTRAVIVAKPVEPNPEGAWPDSTLWGTKLRLENGAYAGEAWFGAKTGSEYKDLAPVAVNYLRPVFLEDAFPIEYDQIVRAQAIAPQSYSWHVKLDRDGTAPTSGILSCEIENATHWFVPPDFSVVLENSALGMSLNLREEAGYITGLPVYATLYVDNAVNVSISPNYQEGSIGESLSYTVTVQNTGRYSDTYSLSAVDTQGWTLDISPPSLSIAAGDSDTATLTVTVGIETDMITVTADGIYADDNDDCTASGPICIEGVPEYQEGVPGEDTCVDFIISNGGNAPDSFIITPSDTQGFDGFFTEATLRAYGMAYVDYFFRDANFGRSGHLYVGNPPHPYYGGRQKTFLKFNLTYFYIPPGSTINSATLYACDVGGGYNNFIVDVRGVNNDVWTERTITWNNAPWEDVGPVLDSVLVTPAGGVNAWDVTSFVRQALGSDRVASFILEARNEGTPERADYMCWVNMPGGAMHGPFLLVDWRPHFSTADLLPTNDAHVVDGGSKNNNYGTNSTMCVGTYYATGENERAFLKFDLSEIPAGSTVNSATLNAYDYNGTYEDNIIISAMCVDNDNWDENTITWNNAPWADIGAILDNDLVDTVGGWNDWDVTSFVAKEFAGDGVASILLQSKNEGPPENEAAGYNSKESPYPEKVHLLVDYTVQKYVVIGPLNPDDNARLTLTVFIPDNAVPCTEDIITVTATSQSDNTMSDNDSCIVHVAPWTKGVILRGEDNAYNVDQAGVPRWENYPEGSNPPIMAAERMVADNELRGAVVAGGFASTCRNLMWNGANNPLPHLDQLLDITFQWMKPGAENVLWYEGHDVYNDTAVCSDLVLMLENLGYIITGDNFEPITNDSLLPYDIVVIPPLEEGAGENGGDPSLLLDNEVQALKKWVENENGGLLVLESSDFAGYNFCRVQNKILEAFGFQWYFQHDSVYDNVNNWENRVYKPLIHLENCNPIGDNYQQAMENDQIGLYNICSLIENAPPTTVYVYNSQGSAFDHNTEGWVWRELGLLNPDGSPCQIQGNNIVNANGQVVGSVIRDQNNNIIGYRNRDGTREAYDLSSGATTAQAYDRLRNGNGGTLIIAKHGTGYIDQQGNRHNGGNITLDGGRDYAGFNPQGQQGGTGCPGLNPYPLPTPPQGVNITVELISCWSANDPDGGGPVTSVVSSLGAVVGAGNVTGYNGMVYSKVRVRISAPTQQQLNNAKNALRQAAARAGFRDQNNRGDIGAWCASLPFNQQHSTLQAIASRHGASITLTYVARAANLADPPEDIGVGGYYVAPMSTGPWGGSLSYEFGSNFAELDLPPGSITDYQVFHITQVEIYPTPHPGVLASGIFDFTPYEVTFPEENLATITLSYFPEFGPTQVDVYFYNENQATWEKITTERSVDADNRTISVKNSHLGLFGVFVSINLVEGWNLVSFPVTSASTTPDNIFENVTYDMFYFDREWGYMPPAPDEPVELGLGYWVKVSENTTATTCGVSMENFSIDLGAGWNLIGFPVTSENTTPDNIFEGVDYEMFYLDPVWGFMPPPSDEPVELGLGYWVKLENAMTVTVPL